MRSSMETIDVLVEEVVHAMLLSDHGHIALWDPTGDAQSYMDDESRGRFVSLMVAQSLFHALILAGK